MKRKLVAAFACRAGGSRLYGKPLQNLEPGYTILDHLVSGAKAAPEINGIVLGISEGFENLTFIDAAHRLGIGYIMGREQDVLMRLIQCGRSSQATDIFRITTECPFAAWELLPEVWRRHVEHGNDITVTDYLPEGVNFEIYAMAALERMYTECSEDERSEYCSAYPRRCPDRFRWEIVEPAAAIKRTDLRFTVDHPEDLILCKAVYRSLKHLSPQIPMAEMFAFADQNPTLTALVQPFVDKTPLWAQVLK